MKKRVRIIFLWVIFVLILISLFAIFLNNQDIKIKIYEKNNSFFENETMNSLSGFVRPFAIASGPNGDFYVSDFGDHSVLVYNENYLLIKKINPGIDILNSPHAVDFDSEGNIYVTDFLNKKIQKFSKKGTFLSTVVDSSFLKGPATAYFDGEENLLISDYSSNSLLKFSKEGKFIGWIGAKKNGGITNGWQTDFENRVISENPGGFDRLHAARVFEDGTIYVVDTWNNRIQTFSKEGKFRGWIGEKSNGALTQGWEKSGIAKATDKLGGFDKPISLYFLDGGNFIVFEFGNGRVQEFSSDGKFLGLLASGFNQGYDAMIKNDKLYVVDTGNKKVQIIGITNSA